MSDRLRVLVVAANVPWPLNGGGRIRLYHFLAQLARSFRVTLAVPAAAAEVEGLGIDSLDTVRVVPAGRPDRDDATPPWIVRRVRQHFGHEPGLSAWLRAHVRQPEYDVVFLHGAVYGMYAGDCRCPVIWNPTDELVLATLRELRFGGQTRQSGLFPHAERAEAVPRGSLGTLGRAVLYGWFEGHIARRVSSTILVSPVDTAWLRWWAGGRIPRAGRQPRVCTIANGVDFDFFQPWPEPRQRHTLAFVGSLEFPPNIDAITNFARRVWPQLHTRDPRRRLQITGRRPVPEVRSLGALPGVEVLGDVDDVRPSYAAAAVVIAPLRKGGGLKNKVLEACAMRRPVVASPTALAGLGLRRGEGVLVARTSGEWLAAIEALLERPGYAAQLAGGGHEYVRRAHRWESIGDQLRELVMEIAGGTTRDRTAAGSELSEDWHTDGSQMSGIVQPARGSLREVPCR